MILRPVLAADADALARVHAASFSAPWTAADIAEVLAGPGAFGVMAQDVEPAGFILGRAIAGEAEILTLAVGPACRRRGVGAALVEAAKGITRAAGAETMFLEVAEDNAAALRLYSQAGFEPAGARRDYYISPNGERMDAKILRTTLKL